jgi:hypothetical protein
MEPVSFRRDDKLGNREKIVDTFTVCDDFEEAFKWGLLLKVPTCSKLPALPNKSRTA